MTFLLKNLSASPSRFSYIYSAWYLLSLMDCLKYFNFVSLPALRCLLIFPFVLGLQRWESFLIFARSFFIFFETFSALFLLTLLASFQFPGCLARPGCFLQFPSFWDCKGENFFSFSQEVFFIFLRLFSLLLLLVFALFSVFKSCLALLPFLPALSVWDCKGETFFRLCKENLSFFKTLDHLPCLSVLYFFSAAPSHSFQIRSTCLFCKH